MTPPRFLIIGASGALGSHLREALGGQAVATYCANPVAGALHFDATTMRMADAVLPKFDRLTHAFLLHGITNIDACARDPQGTRVVNVDATCRLIDDLVAHGVTPIFASSDAVFDGTRACSTETDTPRPILTYGRQKLEVERYLTEQRGTWLVARLSKIVGTARRGDLMKEWLDAFEAGTPIRCATDQIFSPIHVADAVQALVRLATGAHVGTFNVGGAVSLSRMHFLLMLREAAQQYTTSISSIIPCSLRDLDFAEPRPLDTSMSTQKLCSALGLVLTDLRTVCERAVAERYGCRAKYLAPHAVGR